MHTDAFKIYTEQLRNGHVEEISEELSPEFLNVKERDLSFTDKVRIHGQAYIASDDLILQLDIEAKALIPCSICNEPVKVEIEIDKFIHVEQLDQIKAAIFDFSETLREVILLETPSFAECNEGTCPKRKELKKYLKDPATSEEGYRPFADL